MSSVFQEDKESILKAIKYFNSCSDQQKAHLVADIGKYTQEEIKIMQSLLLAIQRDISSHSETTIAQQLFTLGMDKTHAKLMVENIKQKAPTLEYYASIINPLSDEDFKIKFPKIVSLAMMKGIPYRNIANQEGVTIEQVQAIIAVYRNALLPFLRIEISEERLKEVCKKIKFSSPKTDAFLNTIMVNQDFFRKQITMIDSSNGILEIDNIRRDVEKLKEQNEVILKIMKKLLQAIQPSSQNDTTPEHIK